jgi:hypothetical protein
LFIKHKKNILLVCRPPRRASSPNSSRFLAMAAAARAAPAGRAGLTDQALTTLFNKAAGGAGKEISTQALKALLTQSPLALQLHLTERLVSDFVDGWLGSEVAASPAPAAARIASSKSALARASSPKTLLQRARSTSRSSSSSSPSPSPSRGGSPTLKRSFSASQFLAACRELQAFSVATFESTIIVGNGRSVLGLGAGSAVDSFQTVVRFNDYQIEGYEADVGSRTDVWVVSDWTCLKLFSKYPERTIPTLIAVPYRFMGKPYYHERRAEVERDLTPEQRQRCTFVPVEVVQRLVDENHFGDRWPSSGLITISYMLNSVPRVHLHGFDFFKEIGTQRCAPPPHPP